jgi:hypothetical protein
MIKRRSSQESIPRPPEYEGAMLTGPFLFDRREFELSFRQEGPISVRAILSTTLQLMHNINQTKYILPPVTRAILVVTASLEQHNTWSDS